MDWRIQTNFGILDESNLADLVAESVDGSEGQQYEDLDADILRTGGVNAAGNHLQSSAQTDSFNDVDLDARANAEMLSMPSQLPKSIWDDVVWEAITGTLMTVDQLVQPCSRPAFPYTRVLVESTGGFQQSLEMESGNSSVRATRMWCGTSPSRTGKNVSPCCNLHSSVGWLRLFLFSADPQLTTNFSGTRRCKQLATLADVFSGRAPSTLLKGVVRWRR